MFQYFSRTRGTPGRIIRLNYAIDMRYGVLHDVGRSVFKGETLSLGMGHVNVVWQGDANAMVLRALGHCTTPTTPAQRQRPGDHQRALARRSVRPPLRQDAVLHRHRGARRRGSSTPREAMRLFGYPGVPLARLIDWQADWIARGLPSLGKDTHFDTRDGTF